MSSIDFTNTRSGEKTSGENLSYWVDSFESIGFETLNKELSTEVLVIGGGIAGLTTAYCLCKSGKQVVLIEDGLIGSGETGRTTAHITHALDDGYFNIEKVFGEEGSKKAAESHTSAIDWIAKTVREEKIDCNFQRIGGYLFIHPSDTKENLEKEFEAIQKAGIGANWLDHIPGIPSENGPCIHFPNQAQFHIMPYLKGLADAIIKMGGSIYTHTHARHINEKGAQCNGFHVEAKQIVVATNTPVNDFVTIHTKQIPFRTYVIGAKIKKDSVERSLWWDSGDQDSKWFTKPYHYVRTETLDSEFDLLIIGGEDHKTGQADVEDIPEEERYVALIEWTKKRFPIGDIIYQWSGQVLEPLDYMGFIGKNPGNNNVYIVTGDSGNGMTHGTLGGLIVTDLIQEIKNPWEELYSPKRITLKVAGIYASQAMDMIAQYGDYVTRADIKEIDELAINEGAILGKGFKRYAVYRDENSALHAFTAVCPHMACVVQWNAEEKSFDCPCHGSRFTKEGIVINGPATANLKRVNIKE